MCIGDTYENFTCISDTHVSFGINFDLNLVSHEQERCGASLAPPRDKLFTVLTIHLTKTLRKRFH